MKTRSVVMSPIYISRFLLCGFLLSGFLVHSQEFDFLPRNIILDDRNPIYNYVQPKNDTLIIKDYIKEAGGLMNNTYWLNLDTVRNLLLTAASKSQRVNYYKGLISAYVNLGMAYMYKDINDSSRFYFRKTILIDELICNEKQLPNHYWFYGDAFAKDALADSAVMMYLKGKELAEAIQDTYNLQICLYKTSTTYSTAGDNLNALNYAYELLELTKNMKDTSDLLYGLRPLYIVYMAMGQKEKAMELLRTSLKLVEHAKNPATKWRVYYMAMSGYLEMEKYDSVLYYARLNIPIDDLRNEPRMSYSNMALAYLNLNQWDSACYYFHEFYNQAIETGQMDASTYLNLGKCALRTGDKEHALRYYRLAEKNFKEENPYMQRSICQYLSEYFDSTGQSRIALDYLHKFQVLDDSIEQKEKDFEVGLVIQEKESEKLQAQLVLSEKDRELQTVIAIRQREQKNIVYTGTGILLLGLGFGFNRYRKYKELKSKQTLLNERLRISRDLHDEVGATLSGIAMYSQLAQEQIQGAHIPAVKESLNIMQVSSGEMVGKLSDIVWLLNPEHDTLQKLIDKVESYAKHMAKIKRVKVEMNIPDDSSNVHLPVESRKNIYLICKEAITNSIKYSQASSLKIEVLHSDHATEIIVEDNGLGFDINSAQKGNGLENMRKRAEEIGAKLTIETAPLEGTIMTLSCNLIQ